MHKKNLITKILLFVFMMMMVFTLTSCQKENTKVTPSKLENFTEKFAYYDEAYSEENYIFIGYFDENTNKLYLRKTDGFDENAEYQPIYSAVSKDGKINVPNIVVSGKRFAGLYLDGSRITEITDKYDCLTVEFITYADAGLTALICIIIVFLMLALIWGIVSLFKFFPTKKKVEKVNATSEAGAPVAAKKAFTMADIKDDDMMAAALVATIDYHNETDQNVRVVSIKQIG